MGMPSLGVIPMGRCGIDPSVGLKTLIMLSVFFSVGIGPIGRLVKVDMQVFL